MLKNQTSSAEETAFAKANSEASELSQWPKPSISQRGPRTVESTRDGRILTNLLLGFGLVVSTIGGFILDRDYREVSQLERSGRTVQARIYRYDTGDDSISARFNYLWNGELYSGRDHVRRVFRDSHPIGSPLTITVLPSDPKVHRVGEIRPGDAFASNRKTLVVITILISLIGIGVDFTRRAIREQRAMLQSWPATAGIVSQVTAVSDGEGGTSYRVQYRYPLGREIRTETTTRSHIVQEGAVLDLLVNPENPTDVRPLQNLYFARISRGDA